MFAAELEERINRAYADGGYQLGWRFLASPIHVLDGSRAAFIGLNPGGKIQPADHAVMAPVEGSAYVTESWSGFAAGKSPLQRQVRMLFDALDLAADEVLAGNLVPFRSASWQSLPGRTEALRFGVSIWADILRRARPSLIVTMSQPVYSAIKEALGMEADYRLSSGWGNIGIHHAAANGQKLVGLPHLSRFPLLGREASEAALAQAFEHFWRHGSKGVQQRGPRNSTGRT